jgi:hypothetical protein
VRITVIDRESVVIDRIEPSRGAEHYKYAEKWHVTAVKRITCTPGETPSRLSVLLLTKPTGSLDEVGGRFRDLHSGLTED